MTDLPNDNELARRRFINGHIEGVWADLASLKNRYTELREEADLSGSEILGGVFAPHLAGDMVAGLVERYGHYAVGVLEALLFWAKTGKAPDTADAIGIVARELTATGRYAEDEVTEEPPPWESKMRKQIHKLFDEAPKMTDASGNPDPTQAPAVICHVILVGQIQPLYGVLSETPDGLLRMLQKAQVQGERGTKEAVLESFFEYRDVLSVMVEREVKAERGSSILMG